MIHPAARLALAVAATATLLVAPLSAVAGLGVASLGLQRTWRAAARLTVAAIILAASNAVVLRVALGTWEPGVVAGARGAALLAVAGAFVARTAPWEIVAGLGRFPRAAVMLSAVLRMAPVVAEDARRLHDAGRLKGMTRLRRARLAAPLLVQTVLRGAAFGDALALAGFPSSSPRYRRPPWGALDVAVGAGALAIVALVGVVAWK
ncbi:MAG TPA: hypothetical protein VI997_02345 [Candidatus Thermoplasmatota archaeon]|nr:hypothetical protein [Candidatus Thermoplasmatota archaeon]